MKYLWNVGGIVQNTRCVWLDVSETPEIVSQTSTSQVDEDLEKFDAKTKGVVEIKNFGEEVEQGGVVEKQDVSVEKSEQKKEVISEQSEAELLRKAQPLLEKYKKFAEEAIKKEFAGSDPSKMNREEQFQKIASVEKSTWEKFFALDRHNFELGLSIGLLTGMGRTGAYTPGQEFSEKLKEGDAFKFKSVLGAKIAHGAFWGVLTAVVFSNPAVMGGVKNGLNFVGKGLEFGWGAVIHSINDPGAAIDSISRSVKNGSAKSALNFVKTGQSADEAAHSALQFSGNPWELRQHFSYAKSVDEVLSEIELFQTKPEKYRKSEYAQKRLKTGMPRAAAVVARLAQDTFSQEEEMAFRLKVQSSQKLDATEVEKKLSTAATNGILAFYAEQGSEVRDEFLQLVVDQFNTGNPGGDLKNKRMVQTDPQALEHAAQVVEKQGIRGVLSNGLATNAIKLAVLVQSLLWFVMKGRNVVVNGFHKTADVVKKVPKTVWKTVTFPIGAWKAFRKKLKKDKLEKSALVDLAEKTPNFEKKDVDKLWKSLKRSERKKLREELLEASEKEGKLDLSEASLLKTKIKDLRKEKSGA